ncbi:response regulator transcription factor [Salipaludibacillus sp. HK11]|uniref:response regulator transcription factor n=1 Tax=Salipaludibacillus sp. HK11 TaxID=3394320 RepID=UPI0039FC1D61
MYKVLLVDDEVYVRKGLKKFVDWAGCGFEVVSEVGNGEDAYNIIEDVEPDLVITDIKMPVVDGLELIENVNDRLEKKTNFIIISGFNDFTYAQKAVRFGVFDFVLKPIDQGEMETTLHKLSEKLDEEEIENTSKQNFLLEQMFEKSINGNVKESDAPKWSKALGIDQSEYLYYLILELNHTMDSDNKTFDDDKSLETVVKKTIAKLGGGTENIVLYKHQGQGKVLGIMITSDHLKYYNGDIEAFSSQLAKDVSRKASKKITVFTGSKVSNLISLHKSFETANSIRGYKYLLCDADAISYDKATDIPIHYNKLNNKLYVSLMEQIEENNISGIEKSIELTFKEFQEKNFAPRAVETTINHCVYGIIERINNMNGDERKIESLEQMIEWENYNLTLIELKKMFQTFIIEGSFLIHELRKENRQGDIYKIKAYVEKNYHENISLKSIAGKFFMNPVYMGQLFKKTFGVFFKDYLLELRIEEAKKLLRQTNMRVYEIADEIGFGSTDYFVTRFEKINKMTPTEYRNNLLKNN